MIPIAMMAVLAVAQGGTEIARTGLTSYVIVDARVQRELGLTEPQQVAVWDLRSKTDEQFGDLYRERKKREKVPNYRSLMEAEARLNATMLAELAQILDRRQFARYEQIRIQCLRDEALLDPGIQKAVKMDTGQVEKAVSIFVAYLEEYARRSRALAKLPLRDQMREVPRQMREDIELREKTLKELGSLLTDQQRATLDGLKGPIFKPPGRERIGALREQAPMPDAVRQRMLRDILGTKPGAPPSTPRPRP
jgi:hypothetical protein